MRATIDKKSPPAASMHLLDLQGTLRFSGSHGVSPIDETGVGGKTD